MRANGRRLVRQLHPAAALAVALGTLGAAGCKPANAESPIESLRRTIDIARARGSFRVRGEVRVAAPLVAWEGVVVGTDEEYTATAMGLSIESRRLGGASWARRRDRVEPWSKAPYDGAVDLGALLQGHLDASQRRGERWSTTLGFDDVDVLRALTHVPSTGPTTAEVSGDDASMTVVLRLGANATARVEFWDFGGPVSIEPLDTRAASAASTATEHG
jgi:hypothetical protein